MHLPSLVQTGVKVLIEIGFSVGGYLILADVSLSLRLGSRHNRFVWENIS